MTEIIRPTLVLDKEVCVRNIERMAKKAADYKMRFRPHFKTHQSAKIGEWFRDFGVEAITVSSVQMAEYFAANGWHDITIAFTLNILEINNINRLAAKIKLNVLVENTETATFLAEKATQPLGVWIKIDTGNNRTGIDPLNTNLISSVINKLPKTTNSNSKDF